MANYYVRSGAAGAGTGADWANAYTTLTAALSGKTNADTLWVADDHAESTAGAVTLTLPTTLGLKILGVNTHTVEPPTGLVTSPSATVAVGAASAALTIANFGYIYGIHFQGATNVSSSSSITVGSGAAPHGIILDNCKLEMRSTSTGALLSLGPAASGSNDDVLINLKNCTLRFSSTAGAVINYGRLLIDNLSIDSAGSTPTTLFTLTAANPSSMLTENSDLSGESFSNIFSWAVATPKEVVIRNCKLPSAVNVVTGTNPGVGGPIIKMHNCDSADTHIRIAEHSWQGSVVSQTSTRIRSGGATQADGTGFSLLMAGSGNSTFLPTPLTTPEFAVYNTTVGSAMNATVEILRDSATNLTNSDIWLEIQYQGTSGFPQGSVASNRVANIMTTAVDHAASSVTWDTTGMSNANKQKLTVAFTPQEAGYVIGSVKLAANTSVYVDPFITLA